MSDDIALLLADVPPECDRALVIYRTSPDGTYACRWLGLTAEQAASTLYQMADEIVDQKLPPPDWRTRIK